MLRVMEKQDIFLIFDGNAIIHRAFYAVPLLTHNGQLVNAVYGFANVLLSNLQQIQPRWAATAFDLPGKTFRHHEFKEYKAKRVKAPQAMYDQIPIIKNMVRILGVPILEKEGYEADDVIATIVAKVKSQKLKVKSKVIIFTGDKDTFQLVDDGVSVMTPSKGLSRPIEYTPDKVVEKMGVRPGQVVDFKALAGDGSDNIPGVPGIGDKTAQDLLKKFNTLKGIYEAVKGGNPQIPAAVAEKLRENKGAAEMARRLVELRADIDCHFQLSDCLVDDYNQPAAEKFFRELGFKSLLNKLPRARILSNNQEKLF
ncbi:MAG: DNA polymerase I [Candidatus Berkelbacteria bacterium Licking1014_2]|uniref:DNA polymerase I n=1 Tax=Candidatus Berkelbacteria bacterium Licking1014_2 TaxID=2017146 RepID=A0A554LW71_9BACT|nr:MAG: DNA polymerase I [Candidatus Berkelbacteria bacterium Licking1014_2]